MLLPTVRLFLSDLANVSTLAQVLRPPSCDTNPCRYQKNFFRSWPNPLLPILRPHGFSQGSRQSMWFWLNVRTQLPRFQTSRTSNSSAIEHEPANLPWYVPRSAKRIT
jgi:hypothetical protein